MQQYADVRNLKRNGRDVVQVKLRRGLVQAHALMQTAHLIDASPRAKGTRPYLFERCLVGMCGELAFHYYAKALGLNVTTNLGRIGGTQTYDHVLDIGDRNLAIETKTLCPLDGRDFNRLRPNDKLPLSSARQQPEYYAFASVSQRNAFGIEPFVGVTLFAFVPTSFAFHHRHSSRFFPNRSKMAWSFITAFTWPSHHLFRP